MAWRCTLQAVAGLTLNFVNEERFIVYCPEFGDGSFFRASLVIITRTTTKTTICLHSCGCSSGTSSQEWLFRSGSLQTTIEGQKMLAPEKKSYQKSSQEW